MPTPIPRAQRTVAALAVKKESYTVSTVKLLSPF